VKAKLKKINNINFDSRIKLKTNKPLTKKSREKIKNKKIKIKLKKNNILQIII